MNYLLFVYHNEDMKTPDVTTENIGAELSKIMSSNQVKFMFGDKHSIFHFASDFSTDEIDDFLCLVSAEYNEFNYFLTQKTKNIKSNFDEDNLLHLLTLRNTNKKKQTPPKTFEFRMDLGGGEDFARMAESIMHLLPKKGCNLTMDELLDKIGEKGMDSLSEEEKNALELDKVNNWKTLQDKDRFLAVKSNMKASEYIQIARDAKVTDMVIKEAEKQGYTIR